MGFPPGWTDIGGPLPREKRSTKTSRRARSADTPGVKGSRKKSVPIDTTEPRASKHSETL
jgi:hypothetical protein